MVIMLWSADYNFLIGILSLYALLDKVVPVVTFLNFGFEIFHRMCFSQVPLIIVWETQKICQCNITISLVFRWTMLNQIWLLSVQNGKYWEDRNKIQSFLFYRYIDSFIHFLSCELYKVQDFYSSRVIPGAFYYIFIDRLFRLWKWGSFSKSNGIAHCSSICLRVIHRIFHCHNI